MTNKQIEQVKAQLPQGERFNRAYSAFEGGSRVISRDKEGREYHHTRKLLRSDQPERAGHAGEHPVPHEHLHRQCAGHP